MKVSIVVLAQHIEFLKECLSRIERFTDYSYELIVVNDGGGTLMEEWLEQKCTIRTITAHNPIGVASGYNAGARASTGDIIVFLRDYVSVSERWLSCLLSCLAKHSDASMVGPMSNDVSSNQRVPYTCESLQQFDTVAHAMSLTRAGATRKVTRILSHLLVMRKETFTELRGFDERFGLETYEDDDICYRALQQGYSLYISEECFVHTAKLPDVHDDPHWYDKQLQTNQKKAFEKWGFDLTDALDQWEYPITVSLCMIVKNEEQTLDRCLSSICDIVHEIIIIDTGSDDRTKEIATRYTDQVYDFEWVNDFGKARNYAFSLATKEFILWMDADDIMLPEDATNFHKLVNALNWDIDVVSMHYNLDFDIDNNVTSSLRRNRLVKRDKGFKWIGAVHEFLEVHGKILHSDISITHKREHTNVQRNLFIYEQRENEGVLFTARDLYYYGNELSDHKLWERAVKVYELFLENSTGWVEDKIVACGRAADALQALGRTSEAKAKILLSFAYSYPRAENCCRIGSYFIHEEDYERAIPWYRQATEIGRPVDQGTLQMHEYWTWIPHLQLCLCYDRLAQYEDACRHNEIAAAYVPTNSSVLANRQYFASMSVYCEEMSN